MSWKRFCESLLAILYSEFGAKALCGLYVVSYLLLYFMVFPQDHTLWFAVGAAPLLIIILYELHFLTNLLSEEKDRERFSLDPFEIGVVISLFAVTIVGNVISQAITQPKPDMAWIKELRSPPKPPQPGEIHLTMEEILELAKERPGKRRGVIRLSDLPPPPPVSAERPENVSRP